MRILKAGALYFVLVFGAGFALGTIRVLWLLPRLGTRVAELMETPLMLVLTVVASRWVVRRFALPAAPAIRLGVGFVALGLLLAAELGMVLFVQGLTIQQYLANRDPVAGAVYLAALAAFAIMPLLVARR
ncbi:MAG TPA: hypothetical protein VEU96_14865 [Bryobacteraceae bacterium]|nr:hypothetical protein [Bryobacteraceae bacterium]